MKGVVIIRTMSTRRNRRAPVSEEVPVDQGSQNEGDNQGTNQNDTPE